MGGKKKGGGHTPYEAPDSLKSFQKLSAQGIISVGPIKGPVDFWKSTYFDKTPIQNQDGSFNYNNTEIQYNLGYQDQLPLDGFEFSQREVPVNAEVKYNHPITRTVIDNDITRLRLTLAVTALLSQNDKGDTYGTSVDFEVLINNKHYRNYQISGKSSSRFFRSYIIENLPPRPFTITVKRITPDSKSQRLQNGTAWSSFTEIIDTKLNYPNIALIGIKTDSRYNPNFPDINSLLYGRIIKVPSNYDPETRMYAEGIWKGDFKLAWTNNPAWIFYDLVTNKLVGLGKRLGDYGVDKFQLYQIAQYCDQLVPDGYGGQEPRIVSNLWITTQRSAYDVLADMASTFRALVAWNGTQLTLTQDRPTDPIFTFTQANVIGGRFNRQYAPLKSIFTAVEVEYMDERNMYQKAVEYVADDDMIRRFGYNVKKMVAFGCTSRGQARRYGKWVLETSKLEQCTITFGVGRDGLAVLPGDVIEVFDNAYSGCNFSGRILSFSDKTVVLDRPINLKDSKGKSYFSYLNSDKREVKIEILKTDKDNSAIIHLKSEPIDLNEMSVWALRSSIVDGELFKVLGIAENEDGSYSITALQHEPQKQAIVDNGAVFESRNTTTHQAGLLPPSNADISTDGNGINLSFTPPPFVGQGLKFQVKLYRDGKFYELYDDLKDTSIAFVGLPDGEYVAEIRAKNVHGQLSEPVTKTFNISFTVTELNTVSKVFGIGLSWKNPIFANNNAAIELWVSSDSNFQNARKLVSLAYPTNSYSYDGLGAAEEYHFWARMIDTVNGTAGKFTQSVVGTSERAADKLLDYMQGQIDKSTLSRNLIDSLNKDINDAVSEEARQRQANIANIESQISTIKSSIGENNNAEISRISKAVAELSGKVSATHTIKTQSTAGGRTAIAGIALGTSADNQTVESSVIVMANRFSVVKNEADNETTQLLNLISDNGRTRLALNGDIAVQGDLVGNRFIGGEIDISGNEGVLRVGRTGRFEVRANAANRGLVMSNDVIFVYDEQGRVRVKIGRLS